MSDLDADRPAPWRGATTCCRAVPPWGATVRACSPAGSTARGVVVARRSVPRGRGRSRRAPGRLLGTAARRAMVLQLGGRPTSKRYGQWLDEAAGARVVVVDDQLA
ncbi:MAG: hypothetical protein R3E85_07210 [Planctomycetota bacterium]